MMEINQLKLAEKNIFFKHPVGICLESKRITFVLIRTTSSVKFLKHNLDVDKFRNVLALNTDGEVLWTVEEAPLLTVIDRRSPYGGLFFEDDQLIAYHMSGVNYIVDKKDGSIKPRDNGRPW